MTLQSRASRALLYSLIFLSGAAGLIYQVVWHRYLSILLGAEARATAVVLAVFLGGISLGYHVFGRWSRSRSRNLLLLYSLVELGLGFWAYFFPIFFQWAQAGTNQLYHWLGLNNQVIDFIVSVLLMGFPTFLMGGTLPLLTQGLSESLETASQTHARIYGFNTLGAGLGCLLAGFILIPLFDLPTATLIAGTLNLFVGAIAYLVFARRAGESTALEQTDVFSSSLHPNELFLLGVGFCSGFYVLSLETVIMRIAGLATGSSHYNFALVVSLFVFFLGLGSLLVKRMGRFSGRHLFGNQLLVVLFLSLLYWSVDYWVYGAHLVRIALRDAPQNFYLYQALLGICFSLVLLLPIGFSGFTLPLCFHLLKDRKETLGHRVGQLYALNTIGCVMGALVGGYLFLYFFNLEPLFKVCIFLAGVTVALSAAYCFREEGAHRHFLLTGLIGLSLILAFVALAPNFDRANFIQPFRMQAPTAVSYDGARAFRDFLSEGSQFLSVKDDPTSSVAILANHDRKGVELSRAVLVNGKSDGDTMGDSLTMRLTGHFPGLFADDVKRVCVVGLGTGITVGTLAQYPATEQIDVVEISETVLKDAPYFDKYTMNASTSAKVHFHLSDALRYLGGTNEQYDIVISEPSNPWVTGVENLYTKEFYGKVKAKLKKNGMFVQWVQLYSFNNDLVKMVLKTLSSEFPHVTVFQMQAADAALVATSEPLTAEVIARAKARYQGSFIASDLSSVGLQVV